MTFILAPLEDWPGGDWESGDVDRRTDDPAGESGGPCPRCNDNGRLPTLQPCACEAGQRIVARLAASKIAFDAAKDAQRRAFAARMAAAPLVMPGQQMPAPTGEAGRRSAGRTGNGARQRDADDAWTGDDK